MNKILIVGAFACLSVVGVARSKSSQDQSSSSKPAASSDQVTSPRDAASGQASGKRQYNPVIIRKKSERDAASGQPSEVVAPRDSSTGIPTGKKTAQDDWHAPAAKNSNPSVKPVSVADVDQDGAADRKSNIASNPKPQARVAAGDVNGDGVADAASPNSGNGTGQNAAVNTSHSNIKNGRDLATGQASGKRQHEPVTPTRESDKTPAAQK